MACVASNRIPSNTLMVQSDPVTLEKCWGLDLWVKLLPSEMLPNFFAGVLREEGKHTRRYGESLRSTGLNTKTFGCHLRRAKKANRRSEAKGLRARP